MAEIPTAEEILKLPRWARVAFAARCAARVAGAYQYYFPGAKINDVEAVENAIAAANANAANAAAYANANANAANAANAANDAAAKPASFAAAYAANAAAYAAYAAANAAAYADAANAANAAANAANADANADANNAFLGMPLIIRSDFDLLLKLSKLHNWTDKSPVTQSVFGPMWPDKRPPWVEDEKQQSVSLPMPSIDVYIDPGEASEEELADVLQALSNLQKLEGGSGLRFVSDNEKVFFLQGASR